VLCHRCAGQEQEEVSSHCYAGQEQGGGVIPPLLLLLLLLPGTHRLVVSPTNCSGRRL